MSKHFLISSQYFLTELAYFLFEKEFKNLRFGFINNKAAGIGGISYLHTTKWECWTIKVGGGVPSPMKFYPLNV